MLPGGLLLPMAVPASGRWWQALSQGLCAARGAAPGRGSACVWDSIEVMFRAWLGAARLLYVMCGC